jgi:hypothetical protein
MAECANQLKRVQSDTVQKWVKLYKGAQGCIDWIRDVCIEHAVQRLSRYTGLLTAHG